MGCVLTVSKPVASTYETNKISLTQTKKPFTSTSPTTPNSSLRLKDGDAQEKHVYTEGWNEGRKDDTNGGVGSIMRRSFLKNNLFKSSLKEMSGRVNSSSEEDTTPTPKVIDFLNSFLVIST